MGRRPLSLLAWLFAWLPAWLAPALLAACADTGPVLRSARAQQHAAVVLAYLDTLHNRHDTEQARHLYLGASYVDHAPGVTPEGHAEIVRSVSQGDLVAVQSRIAPAEGGPRLLLLELFRLYQGHIVDRWASTGPDDGRENPVPVPARPVR